ncbi:hypothetical protein BKA61DRAFT_615526 [Leptodontidium sp. MPI-SDFR-AT-0119]|nr:hypothetical protein BKA61DRAFT_615526 [Leptodontidium sp. MPI-SDFR-AT-0119]
MPPTTPTKKGNASLTPYSRPSDKNATPVKSTSIPSSPAEKATTPTSSLFPASSREEKTNRSPSFLPSIETPDVSPRKPPKQYVFDFGKYNGRALSQVPGSYITWLKTKIRGGSFSQERYNGLRASLADDGGDDDGDLESDLISGPLLANWTPPALGLASSIFHEDVTCSPLWISENDAGHYFKLSSQYLGSLPKVAGGHGGLIGNAKARYYLFHVYEFVKTHASKAVADRALERFLQKNEGRVQEIYGMLGLGAGECCW